MEVLLGIVIVQLLILSGIILFIYFTIKQEVAINSTRLSSEFGQEVQVQRHKKPFLPAKLEKKRGRSITQTEDLVDISELPFEQGYEAITGQKING